MNGLNLVLVTLILACCLSLVTSRQEQRLTVTNTERAQAQTKRLEQDFQNLTVKQQQLEETERIERIARQERGMIRIPAASTHFVSLEKLP